MKNNEYNSVNVTNEKRPISFEYTKAQEAEFTSFSDNKQHYKDELNTRHTVNDSVEENTLHKTKKVKDYKKMKEGPTHLASTAGHAVVAASTISVAVVAVAVGIQVLVPEEKNLVNFPSDSVEITSTSIDLPFEMSYDYVTDTLLKYEPKSEPNRAPEESFFPCFRAVLTDGVDYQYYTDITFSDDIEARISYAYIHFEDLTPNTYYSISIQQNAHYYEDNYSDIGTYTFVTLKTPEADYWFNSITFGSTNLDNMSFEVTLDYVDKSDSYLSFSLLLTNEDETKSSEITLRKTTEVQTVQIPQGGEDVNGYEIDLSSGPISYVLSAVMANNQEKVELDSGVHSFVDNSYYFDYIEWDRNANFAEMTFNLVLHYVDNGNHFKAFKLNLTSSTDLTQSVDIDLQVTEDVQKVQIPPSRADVSDGYALDLNGQVFIYTLTATYSDNTTEEVDTNSISFEDNSYQFNSVKWGNTANYATETFSLSIDYEDPNGYYKAFNLMLTDANDESKTCSFDLALTTGSQEFTVPNVEGSEDEYQIDLANEEFKYSIVATYKNGTTETVNSGTASFIDESFSFNGVTFGEEANYADMKFDLTLNYEDPNHYYKAFALTLTEVSDTSKAVSIPLELSTEKKIYQIPQEDNEYVIDLSNEEFTYSITATYLNNTTAEVAKGDVNFIDSSYQFKDVTFGEESNFSNMNFSLTLDYEDANGYYTGFDIKLSDSEANLSSTITLELSKQSQIVQIPVSRATDFGYEIDLASKSLSYEIIVTYKNGSTEVVKSDDVLFSDSSFKFNSIEWGSNVNYSDMSFDLTLDYTDANDYFTGFVLNLVNKTDSTQTFETALIKQTTSQTVEVPFKEESETEHEIDLSQGEFDYTLTATYKNGSNSVVDEGVISFNDTSFKYNGITFSNANHANMSFTVTLDYVDPNSYYTNFSLNLTKVDNPNEACDIELAVTTDSQIVTVPGEEVASQTTYDVDITSGNFNYTITATYRNETTAVVDDGTTSFTDNSYSVSSFSFGNAIFAENKFEATIEYTDPNGYYDHFELSLTNVNDSSEFTDINLGKPISGMAGDYYIPSSQNQDQPYEIDLSDGEYNYEVNAISVHGSNVGVASGTHTFVDDSFEYNRIDWDQTASYNNQTFDLRIDYVDEYTYFTNFSLNLTSVNDETQTCDFELELSHETQTVEIPTTGDMTAVTYPIDITTDTFIFTVTATYANGKQVVVEDGQVRFEDSDVHRFNKLVTDYIIGVVDYCILLKLDYEDEWDYFQSFTLQIDFSNGEDETGQLTATLPLEFTVDWQYVDVEDLFYGRADYNEYLDTDVTVNVLAVTSNTLEDDIEMGGDVIATYSSVQFSTQDHYEVYGGTIVSNQRLYSRDMKLDVNLFFVENGSTSYFVENNVSLIVIYNGVEYVAHMSNKAQLRANASEFNFETVYSSDGETEYTFDEIAEILNGNSADVYLSFVSGEETIRMLLQTGYQFTFE